MSSHYALDARAETSVDTWPRKTISLFWMSWHIVHFPVLHCMGFRLAKSTSLSRGDGNFANVCCMVILFDEIG